MTLETSIIVVGMLVIILWNGETTNTMISDVCKISGNDAEQANKIYQIKNPREGEMNINLLISAVVA